MILEYEYGFVAFTWSNLCLLDYLSLLFIVLVGRNFVFGICELKPKSLILFVKKPVFSSPAFYRPALWMLLPPETWEQNVSICHSFCIQPCKPTV